MAVIAAVWSDRQAAASGRRSSANRPSSSAARCPASDADPPLPKNMTLPPARRLVAIRSAASAVATTGSAPSEPAVASSIRCPAATLSAIRCRSTPSRSITSPPYPCPPDSLRREAPYCPRVHRRPAPRPRPHGPPPPPPSPDVTPREAPAVAALHRHDGPAVPTARACRPPG